MSIMHEAKVLGFPVAFSFDAELMKMAVEWDPHVPDMRKWNVFMQKRFRQEYKKARNVFGQIVADDIGEIWVVVDVELNGDLLPTAFVPSKEGKR